MIRAMRYQDETSLALNLANVLQLTPDGAREATTHLPSEQRAELALFCYARAHLREKGLAIATLCGTGDLIARSSIEIAASLIAQAASFAQANPHAARRSNFPVTLFHGQHV